VIYRFDLLDSPSVFSVLVSNPAAFSRLAHKIAMHEGEFGNSDTRQLVRWKERADYPLPGTPPVHVVRHGVGFHHAGLPIEVLEALEDAVRADTLPYLACTSTLMEGVNMPVRTVVIYDSPAATSTTTPPAYPVGIAWQRPVAISAPSNTACTRGDQRGSSGMFGLGGRTTPAELVGYIPRTLAIGKKPVRLGATSPGAMPIALPSCSC